MVSKSDGGVVVSKAKVMVGRREAVRQKCNAPTR